MPRKRTYDEMAVTSASPAPVAPTDDMISKLRNMWEFACLFEWIVLFGQAVKLPSIDIDVCDSQHTLKGLSDSSRIRLLLTDHSIGLGSPMYEDRAESDAGGHWLSFGELDFIKARHNVRTTDQSGNCAC